MKQMTTMAALFGVLIADRSAVALTNNPPVVKRRF
ncbi:hypothetical protein ABIE78_005207 [Sinorhizobium fredii]